MGTTLGLILAAYLKLVAQNLLLVLLALGFGMTEFMRYVHIDPLLSFLTAGFVVQNLSAQGEKLLHALVDRLLRYNSAWRLDEKGRGLFFGSPRLDVVVVGRPQ